LRPENRPEAQMNRWKIGGRDGDSWRLEL